MQMWTAKLKRRSANGDLLRSTCGLARCIGRAVTLRRQVQKEAQALMALFPQQLVAEAEEVHCVSVYYIVSVMSSNQLST